MRRRIWKDKALIVALTLIDKEDAHLILALQTQPSTLSSVP